METHEEYTHKGARRKENALSMPISRGKKNEVSVPSKEKKSFLLDHTVKKFLLVSMESPRCNFRGGFGMVAGEKRMAGCQCCLVPCSSLLCSRKETVGKPHVLEVFPGTDHSSNQKVYYPAPLIRYAEL